MNRSARPFLVIGVVLAAIAVASPALAAPGDPMGPEVRLLAGGQTWLASLAATDAQGNLVALRNSKGQRYTANGSPIGVPFDIAFNVQPGYMAMEPDGDFAVAWRNSNISLDVRCFAFDGAPKGEPVYLGGPDTIGDYEIAMDADGDFAIAYVNVHKATPNALYSTQKVLVQRFTKDCGAVGDPSVAAQRTGRGGGFLSTQLAMSDAGDFVVVWEATGTASDGIHARSYRANGSARTFARTVSPRGKNYGAPEIAMAADGSHAIVWHDRQGTPADLSVAVRLYDAAGRAKGVAFFANAPATVSAASRSVAMSDDGHFVVSWTDDSLVYARRFAPDGGPLGEPFRVSAGTTTGSAQAFMDSDGDFTLFWTGFGTDLANGTFVRRYFGS